MLPTYHLARLSACLGRRASRSGTVIWISLGSIGGGSCCDGCCGCCCEVCCRSLPYLPGWEVDEDEAVDRDDKEAASSAQYCSAAATGSPAGAATTSARRLASPAPAFSQADLRDRSWNMSLFHFIICIRCSSFIWAPSFCPSDTSQGLSMFKPFRMVWCPPTPDPLTSACEAGHAASASCVRPAWGSRRWAEGGAS